MKQPNLSTLKAISIPIGIAIISGCVTEPDSGGNTSQSSETSSTTSVISSSSSSQQNSGEPYQWGLHAMQFSEAWQVTKGNAYVSISDAIGRQSIEVISGLSNARPHFSTENSHEESVIPHGTHVAGIVGADGANGIYGGCPGCSLYLTTTADGYKEIYRAAKSGLQVVNISYGGNTQNAKDTLDGGHFRDFMDVAQERDLLIIAATGNVETYQSQPQYPAQFAYEGMRNILPVGGLQPALIDEALIDFDTAIPDSFYVSLTPGEQWTPLQGHDYAGCQQILTSQNPGVDGVMAPAAHILSLYPTGQAYGSLEASTCIWSDGDSDPVKPNDGIGLMSGTSMAAPHITALAGLIRSVNPLLTAEEVIEIIQLSADEADQPTAERGHGMPSAKVAVDLTVQSNPDLRTPLFAFQNRRANASDAPFFYTTVPQMALSALHGELIRAGGPNTSEATDYISYGAPISDYASFPGIDNATDSQIPQAAVQVYTVPTLPSGSQLVPLYRMSNARGFAYATSDLERIILQSEGFEVDGVEGYLHPSDSAPDDDAILLIQGYNNTTDSYALYAEGSERELRELGYQPSSALGYAVVNNPSYRATTTPSQLTTGPCSLRASAGDPCVIDAIAQYADESNGEFVESVYAYGHLWQFDEHGNQIGEMQNLKDIARYATGPCSRAENDKPCTINSATTMDYPNEGIGYVESPYAYGYFWNFFASGEQWPEDSTNLPLSSVDRYAEGACEGNSKCSFDTRNLIVWEGWGDGLIESITVGDSYWIYDGTGEIIQSGTLRDIDRFAQGPCRYGSSNACRFDSRDLYNDKNDVQWETVTAYGRYFEWKDGMPTANHGRLLTDIERLR